MRRSPTQPWSMSAMRTSTSLIRPAVGTSIVDVTPAAASSGIASRGECARVDATGGARRAGRQRERHRLRAAGRRQRERGGDVRAARRAGRERAGEAASRWLPSRRRDGGPARGGLGERRGRAARERARHARGADGAGVARAARRARTARPARARRRASPRSSTVVASWTSTGAGAAAPLETTSAKSWSVASMSIGTPSPAMLVPTTLTAKRPDVPGGQVDALHVVARVGRAAGARVRAVEDVALVGARRRRRRRGRGR